MTPLSLTTTAVATVISEVAAWGARDVETGGFLLGDDAGTISGVALSAAAGISRHRDQFVVSGRAMATLFAYADEHGYAVRAQFHSHGGHAFLSRSDLRHGFNVEGFITTVVPAYAAPPPDPTAWGWWTHIGKWISTAPPVVLTGDTRVLRFDEDGAGEI
jgi:hypothetical protein